MFAVCAMRTVWLRPCSENVSTVATNSNKTTLEANSHADTTCLGGGGGLSCLVMIFLSMSKSMNSL